VTRASPTYRVQLFAFAPSTYGIGTLIAEFENAKAVGWGDYANEVPEAFFTLDQDDPKALKFRTYEGKSHVRIYRDGALVLAGWAAMELDATERDVIVYCYGYLAGLFWSLSDWNQQWKTVNTKTLVDDLWVRAKTTITNSMLNFVATGTTQALVTTSGGSTEIVLPKYSAFYKRIINVYREMAALGISDTSNTPIFQITHSTTPTFNFWKSNGQDRANVEWRYGSELMAGYRVRKAGIWRRNNVFAVGSAPNNQLLREEYTNATDRTNYGTRQDSAFFPWVRDQTELQRAIAWRTARAMRDDPDVTLRFHPNAVIPPGGTGAGFALADRVKLVINHGSVNIDGYYLVSGVEVLWIRGVEHVKAFLEERFAG
jgi:hypothetical protein